jgi:hypothetical protein
MLPTGATHPGEDMSHPEINTPPPRRWFTPGFKKRRKPGTGATSRKQPENWLPSPIFQRGRLDIPYLRHWSGLMLEAPAERELDELIATYEADRPA